VRHHFKARRGTAYRRPWRSEILDCLRLRDRQMLWFKPFRVIWVLPSLNSVFLNLGFIGFSVPRRGRHRRIEGAKMIDRSKALDTIMRYLWIAFAVGMFAVYSTPSWPRVWAPLPWRGWTIPFFLTAPFFLALAGYLCVSASKHIRISQISLLFFFLLLYLFAEGVFGHLVFMPKFPPHFILEGLLIIGLVNLWSQLKVCLVFLAFCGIMLVWNRFQR
jgi:hypothetical protein